MSRRPATVTLDEELENKNTMVLEEETEDIISLPPSEAEDEGPAPTIEELVEIEVEEKVADVIPENLVWTYLRSMGKIPLLTLEKEVELLTAVAKTNRIMKRLSKKKRLTIKEKKGS